MADRLEQLMQFHEADPADTFITYGIAMEHAKRGDVDKALHWLETTLTSDPDYAYAWYQKAHLLSEADRTDEARAAVEQGLAAAKRSNDAHAAEELTTLGESM